MRINRRLREQPEAEWNDEHRQALLTGNDHYLHFDPHGPFRVPRRTRPEYWERSDVTPRVREAWAALGPEIMDEWTDRQSRPFGWWFCEHGMRRPLDEAAELVRMGLLDESEVNCA